MPSAEAEAVRVPGGKEYPDSMKNNTSAALLNRKTYATFDGAQPSKSLPILCLKLLSEQKKTWPDLRQAYASLKQVRTRRVRCRGFSVLLQHNPGRAFSSLARVDERNINERPCFLCPGNLPEGQKGILYRNNYLILCNPAPVFPSHFTIAHIDHRPQAISEHIDLLLQLMADIGSGWTLLYNGPQCGASAPDHFHFQAVPSGLMPIEKELRRERRVTLITETDGVLLYRARNVGREVIILEGGIPTVVGSTFTRFLDALKRILRVSQEPMINVAGLYEEEKWRLVVFPRRKHRPDVFFEEGDARIVVSPAVIEMGGVLVTPFEKDFERLDKATVESIYEEVSLEEKSLEEAIDAMA